MWPLGGHPQVPLAHGVDTRAPSPPGWWGCGAPWAKVSPNWCVKGQCGPGYGCGRGVHTVWGVPGREKMARGGTCEAAVRPGRGWGWPYEASCKPHPHSCRPRTPTTRRCQFKNIVYRVYPAISTKNSHQIELAQTSLLTHTHQMLDCTKIGAAFQRERLRQKLSIKSVSFAGNVPEVYIETLEKGGSIELKRLISIAWGLKVYLHDLLAEAESGVPRG